LKFGLFLSSRSYASEAVKKIIPFVVYHDESREVLYLYFPYCFHSQIFERDALDLFNAVSGEPSPGAAD
jgi:hypothetical protein